MLKKEVSKMLRMLSLCSGIGGADLAATWTGHIEIVGQVEIDPFCQAVLAKHWPNVKRVSDIREVEGHEFGRIDILVGGIPCQPFSNAGKQTGQSDDRYLWPEMFRIVKAIYPTWVVIENVDDFTYMALDDVQADLESEDYAVQAFVLPACAVGAPHIRERCFVVAHSNQLRDCGQESTITDRGCSATLSAGICERENPTSVAHTSSPRWQEQHITPIATGAGYAAWRKIAPGTPPVEDSTGGRERKHQESRGAQGAQPLDQQSGTRDAQSRVRGNADGLSSWLHLHRWPALPGQEQEAWEPSRTVTEKQPYRNQRLKALGNAIVPQQIFPIFQCIVDVESEHVA